MQKSPVNPERSRTRLEDFPDGWKDGIILCELANALKVEQSLINESISNLFEAGALDKDFKPTKDAEASIQVPEDEIFIVYKYVERPDAPPLKEGGKSRDFCKKMMAKKKLYSKKEIDVLRNDMKSSGIADVTDVWLSRGGWYRKPNTDVSVPYCRHIWKQVIVRKK